MRAKRKHVLVLGDYRQTIVVVRSLARAGYRVTLGSCDSYSSTAWSWYVDDFWLYSHENDERFHQQLESYLRAEKPDFVFVVGETQLRSLIAAADRLVGLSRWVAPAWSTARLCFDKNAMYELTRELGVPTPDWTPFRAADFWREQAQRMGYPVVIKGRDSSAHVRGKKALIIPDRTALDAFLSGSDGHSDALLLQKFARGERHNCHFGAAGGKLVIYFQQKVLRTDEPDCTGIGIEGISVPPSPVLKAYCARITEALGYNGIGCIQFLVDEATGQISFLEINARMDSTAALPYRLGYDFPRLAVDLAACPERVASRPAPRAYRCGARYHWLFGDALALGKALRTRSEPALTLLLWTARCVMTAARSHHLTWDPLDPLPTLHGYARALLRHAAKAASVHRPSALRAK